MYYELVRDGFITKEEDIEPEIGPFMFYLSAYWELATCRSGGMEEGPIPFTAIKEYFNSFPEGDFYEFLGIIRAMDDCYLKERQSMREREKNASRKTK